MLTPSLGSLYTVLDPIYGSGVVLGAFYCSGWGSLARLTPLFLCDLAISRCFNVLSYDRKGTVGYAAP